MTPRGLLFLGLDQAGTTYVGIPENVDEVEKIKVGHKLALTLGENLDHVFFVDSVHRLNHELVLFNGDRRLGGCGNAVEVALITALFLKATSARNVFLGCTPHQPGSWLVRNEDEYTALHQRGYVEVIPAPQGLIARRILDEHLFFLPADEDGTYTQLDPWQEVFTSPLGNILMLERRIVGNRLVLTCERGLVEVNVAALPAVREVRRVEMSAGFGVVGRIDGGAFAVTTGKPEPWGFDDMRPAVLIGTEGTTLTELALTLSREKHQAGRHEQGGDAGNP